MVRRKAGKVGESVRMQGVRSQEPGVGMKLVRHLAILTLVIGCGPVFGLLFPRHELKGLPVAAAEWRLADQKILSPVPAELKNFRSGEWARKAWRGDYACARPMTVTVYGMPAGGFDAIQQWRVTPGKMAFLKGGYFGIAESPGASQGELARFVRGVEAALPRGNDLLR